MQKSSVSDFAGRSAVDILRDGHQQHRAGQLDRAAAAYRHVLAIEPQQADALHLLGVVAYQQGRHQQAVDAIGQAIRLRADQGDYHGNMGLALQALGRLAEAAESYRVAVRLQPGFLQGHNNLGNILSAAGRYAEAEACYRRAIDLQPDNPEIANNLACALLELGRYAEAEHAYRRALGLRPDLAEANSGLGNVFFQTGRLIEAEEICRTALAMRPDSPDILHSYGNTQYGLGRLAEAEASYRAALALDARHKKARYNLSHVLLLTGRLAEGWQHYEWRTETHGAGRREFAAPLWNGEAIDGRTLLIHAEQGLGDTLQFCRYLPLIAGRARLVLEVQAPLLRLVSAMAGAAQIVAQGDPLPAFDVHCPLLSLPRILGTTLETIPGTVPYLAADPQRSAEWRQRLAPLRGLRVGLVWAGGARPNQPELTSVDARRSMTLDRMAPLGDIAGVSFVSLQKGGPAAQAARPPHGMALHDFTEDLADFADTAALVDNLDLVIGVDTSVPHLAGALGKPVWLLNRFDTCWRWLLDRDDSPWYPTLRQFRQPAPGDWDSVMAEVRTALRRLAGAPE